MKKVAFLTLLILVTVGVTLAFTAAVAAPKTPAQPAAAAAVPAGAAAAAMPEKHPHIDEALEHMRAAKHQLEIAEHDFEGHRVKSIEHLDQAIHEAEICNNMK